MRIARATYEFINAMTGNESGFEEATRAWFVGDYPNRGFDGSLAKDIWENILKLAKASLTKSNKSQEF